MQAAGPRALRCSTAVIVINTRVHGRHTHTHTCARGTVWTLVRCVLVVVTGMCTRGAKIRRRRRRLIAELEGARQVTRPICGVLRSSNNMRSLWNTIASHRRRTTTTGSQNWLCCYLPPGNCDVIPNYDLYATSPRVITIVRSAAHGH